MWRLAENTITQPELDAAADWLRTAEIITQGEQIRRFEAGWATWQGSAYAVFVSSGSAANFCLVAAAADRVQRRPLRIGVSAVTWSTNISPSLLLGHEIVVFDIDPTTLGVAPEPVLEAIESGAIDVLFLTHLLGFDAIDDRVVQACAEHGVLLLEDCCEAHGASHRDQHVGTFGLGSTFSFYYGHHMSTIEGGVVCTDDPQLADRVRLMRSHGLARESSLFEEYAAASPDIDPRFLFVAVGLNFRSTELNALLGLSQLRSLDERIAQRNRNLERFLAGVPGWIETDYRVQGTSSYALPLVARDADAAERARGVVDSLGIERRPLMAGNLLKHPFLQDAMVGGWASQPNADHVHRCGLYVGNGPHVTLDSIDKLTAALRAV